MRYPSSQSMDQILSEVVSATVADFSVNLEL